MKYSIGFPVFLGALLTVGLAGMPVVVHAEDTPSATAQSAGGMDEKAYDSHMEQMSRQMQTMQKQMNEIQAAKTPSEREKLLQEHWMAMQGMMNEMHGMMGYGYGMHRRGMMGNGMGMGRHMRGGGMGMMYGPRMSQSYQDMSPEQMKEHMYMMNGYMDMQQQMMNQMMQHNYWMTHLQDKK